MEKTAYDARDSRIYKEYISLLPEYVVELSLTH